jgi:hypothetical protein
VLVKSIYLFPDSSDRCERAFKFTQCFWDETKEVSRKSRYPDCVMKDLFYSFSILRNNKRNYCLSNCRNTYFIGAFE